MYPIDRSAVNKTDVKLERMPSFAQPYYGKQCWGQRMPGQSYVVLRGQRPKQRSATQ